MTTITVYSNSHTFLRFLQWHPDCTHTVKWRAKIFNGTVQYCIQPKTVYGTIKLKVSSRDTNDPNIVLLYMHTLEYHQERVELNKEYEKRHQNVR